MASANQCTQIVRIQSERLTTLYADKYIEDFRHVEMAELLQELYTLQGKCERIKNFPLPRQYSTATHWFVKMFLFLLPMAMLGVFGEADILGVWLAVPATAMVGWVFYMWDLVVDYSENPFEGLMNDIPMDALTRTIEIDLREMLGETELPPPVEARHGVLQ